MAEQPSLRGHYVGVAGTENFLDALDPRGAERHRGHGLRPANLIKLRRARFPNRVQQVWIDRRRRAHDNFRAARHFRERIVINTVETSGAVPPGM